MDYVVDIETGLDMYLENARLVRNFPQELVEEDEDAILDYAVAHGEPVRYWELADHMEAIKEYLKENKLPDVTKQAFLVDLLDIVAEVR